MQKAGFDVRDGDHPIVPIMLGDANLAQSMSKKLLEKQNNIKPFLENLIQTQEKEITFMKNINNK
jgi:7-keto-8-aminopelargonate synthetase-like enzyme